MTDRFELLTGPDQFHTELELIRVVKGRALSPPSQRHVMTRVVDRYLLASTVASSNLLEPTVDEWRIQVREMLFLLGWT